MRNPAEPNLTGDIFWRISAAGTFMAGRPLISFSPPPFYFTFFFTTSTVWTFPVLLECSSSSRVPGAGDPVDAAAAAARSGTIQRLLRRSFLIIDSQDFFATSSSSSFSSLCLSLFSIAVFIFYQLSFLCLSQPLTFLVFFTAPS